MAIRRTKCPECGSFSVTQVREYPTGTKSLFADVDLRCEDCSAEWAGRVLSEYGKEQRKHGRVRI